MRFWKKKLEQMKMKLDEKYFVINLTIPLNILSRTYNLIKNKIVRSFIFKK